MVSWALFVFVCVQVSNILVLLFDWWLYLTNRTTISEYAGVHPWLAVAIITFEMAGTLALTWHFLIYVFNHA